MPQLPSAVLFACTANAIRSPMAAALFRAAHGQRVYVESVGVEPGEPDPFVPVVLAEAGIGGLDSHQPKAFEDLADDSFEVIVALSRKAYDRAQEITRTVHCEVVFWPIDDPAEAEGNREARLDAYRRVRDDLRLRILREWPMAEAAAAPAPVEAEAASKAGMKLRHRGRDLWSRMRTGIRRIRR